MRVTMQTMYGRINNDLGELVNRQARANSDITSGMIYRLPSDAPVELTHALGVRSSINGSSQMLKNIKYAQGWVKATESAVTGIQDRLLRAKTLAVQGANDSQSPESRQAIAVEIKAIREEIVALGNTQLGGRYLFGGTRTTGYERGEAPFVLEDDGRVRYLGNREGLAVETAPGRSTRMNLDGHSAIMQSGLFDALDTLYNGLVSNSRPDIDTSIGDIDSSLEWINSQITVTGSQANTFNQMEAMNDNLKFTGTERLSDIQDTDIIEAINELKASETSYQAALASSAKVMNLSLADYL
jgi:flagellar hook-associated protein 3 FlgL